MNDFSCNVFSNWTCVSAGNVCGTFHFCCSSMKSSNSHLKIRSVFSVDWTDDGGQIPQMTSNLALLRSLECSSPSGDEIEVSAF